MMQYYISEMGCTGSDTDESNNYKQLVLKLMKTKIEIESTIERLKSKATMEEATLIREFAKPKPNRALGAERGLANTIVIMINKIHCYILVKGHIEKLLNYKNLLSQEQKKKADLRPSVEIILFFESILKDSSIRSLCQSLRQNFVFLIKQAQPDKIDSPIAVHHKTKELPTQKMLNDYLLSLINQESLDLKIVNEIGHNIKF